MEWMGARRSLHLKLPAKVNGLGQGGGSRGREAAERLRLALRPSPGAGNPFPGAGATSFRGSERLRAGARGAQQQSSADGRCVGWVGGWKEGDGCQVRRMRSEWH